MGVYVPEGAILYQTGGSLVVQLILLITEDLTGSQRWGEGQF